MSDREFAEELFEEVRRDSVDLSGGVTRSSYSRAETDALGIISARATSELGLNCTDDATANLWMWPSDAALRPRVVTGSHVDSVKCGGNYDGLAGVVAGMIAVRRLHPGAPAAVVALRGEEGAWYDRPYKGSLALFGKLDPGPELARAMRSCGAYNRPNPKFDDLRAFIELHIEQGPVLENFDDPVGVVTGICGCVRYKIRCLGEAGHSGTTPANLRKDAVFAVVELLSHVEDRWAIEGGGDSSRVTCGVLHTDATTNAVTRIADRVDFCLECRSAHVDVLADFAKDLRALVKQIEHRRGVRFEILDERLTPPAELHPELIAVPSDRFYVSLPSGAGHDAAVFAQQGIPSAMIFVRNSGGSHNPREAMRMDDFMVGVDLLEASLRKVLG